MDKSKGLLLIICLMASNLLSGKVLADTQALPSAMSGRDIALKMQSVDTSDTSSRHGTMLIKRKGQSLKRSLVTYLRQNKNGQSSLIDFVEPADIRGTRFLNWVYEDLEKEDDMWIYLPGENLTRRISGSGGKTGRFMRSDFNNEDIQKRYAEDDKQTLLREERLFDQGTYVVDFVPVDLTDSNYSKRTVWVNKQTFLPVKIAYFDKSGQQFKTALYGGVQQINGIWTVTKIKMETPRQSSVTLLQYQHTEYNPALDDGLFTQANLSRQ